MKVKIDNYQIIKHADLEFLPGITAIVGSSNNGKSSIIRAIEAAINNKGGNSFVNYDADECSVSIETDGNKIIWTKHKKQGKSSYDINGDVLNKIGQKQIPEVGDTLNMREIEVGNERFRLNFWKQMSYPFLVDKTSYQLFDFISRSNEQEIILGLQNDSADRLKQISKDEDIVSGKIDVKTTDIGNIQTSIKELKKFEKFDVKRLELLNTAYKVISAKLSSVDEIDKSINEESGTLKNVINIINKVSPTIDDISRTYKTYESLELLLSDLAKVNESIKSETNNLDTLKDLTNKTSNKVSTLTEKFEAISELNSSFEAISSVIEEYNTVLSSIEAENSKIEGINKVIKDVQDELDTFTICPLCEQPLNSHK